MFEFLKKQLANLLLQNSQQKEQLFGESKFVYFADGPTEDNRIEEESEAEEEEVEEPETPAEKASAESEQLNTEIAYYSEQALSVLDSFRYKLPPDVDPDRIENARQIVNENAAAIEAEKQNNRAIKNIAKSVGEHGNKALEEDLWRLSFALVPEVLRLREKNEFSQNEIPTMLGMKLRPKLKVIFKKHTENKVKVSALNKAQSELLKLIDTITEYEFEMHKSIADVQNVMWDMFNKRQTREIQERAIKGAEMFTGLNLDQDEVFAGIDREIIEWDTQKHENIGDIKPKTKEYKDVKFILKDIYVDKQRTADPESPTKKQMQSQMQGLYVAILNTRTGQVYRMKMNNFKEFASLHRLQPFIDKKKDLPNKVKYLNEMNIDLHPGMTLEYEDWELDQATQRREPIPKFVKIKYFDDKIVQLDTPITTYSPFDHPDPKYHVMKDEMSLGEFAQWLIKRRALPEMPQQEMEDKLHEHYEYMNTKYERKPECHRPINLVKGEVIFADAPGNPLFEINTVGPKAITLTNGKHFTYPQFLRWVYQYDIEPYDPSLEGEKVKQYFERKDAEKKFFESLNTAAERAEKDAEKTIAHLRDTGKSRDTMKDWKDNALEGTLEGKKVPLKTEILNDVQRKSHSWARQFIKDTELLRLDDIFEMFKVGWEYKKRNWERKQKARYSKVGKGIPWFGTEFERINQQSETEEMQQFKDSMDQWGVRQIQDTLYSTNNSDQAKACFNVLAEKGQIRWDDPNLWKAINKHTNITHKIPLPLPGMDPYMPFRAGTGIKFNGVDVAGKSAVDFIPEALDSIWGESTYIDWKRQNDGALEDGIQKSFNKAEELESDPKNTGGIANELAVLLERHMRGEYVEPSEFEGMLRFIIEAGKANGHHKMYYLLMGTSAKDPSGRTLMGWDRVGRFISKYSNNFPPLDYYSASNQAPKRDLETGEIFERQWVRQDFDKLTKPWVNQIRANGGHVPTKPPAGSWDFLWKEVLTSDAFQSRLEKGIRSAQDMDHDDSPFFIPALKESEVESACAASGGETKKFTVQGYKNGYIGFGLRLKYLNEKVEEEKGFEAKGEVGFSNQYLAKMISSFRSYMRYDSILDYRYRRTEASKLQRFSSNDFKTGCVWDGAHAIQDYRDEMKGVIMEVIAAYGQQDNADLTKTPFTRLESVRGDKDMKKEQDKIENAVENWGPTFERMIISDDGGKKFLEVISKRSKTFMFDKISDQSPQERIRNKMDMAVFEADRKETTDDEGEMFEGVETQSPGPAT